MSNKTTTLDEAIAKITANKQECSICYKPLIDRTATLKCNHTFHKDCYMGGQSKTISVESLFIPFSIYI
jgi:hypothetical protein